MWRIFRKLRLHLLFEFFAQFVAARGQVLRYKAIVDAMEYTLRYYNLMSQLPKDITDSTRHFTESYQKELIETIPLVDVKDEWIKSCAREIAGHFEESAKIQPDLLELIFKERERSLFPAEWSKLKGHISSQLAEVLMRSRRLLRATEQFPYKATDLERLLREAEVFSLEQVMEELERLHEVVLYTTKYLVFLQENDVSKRTETPNIENLLDIIRRTKGLPTGPLNLDRITRAIPDVLTILGRTSVEETIALSDDLKEKAPDLKVFTLITLAIFLTRADRDPSIVAPICRGLAEFEDGVRITWAYLELKQDLRRESKIDGKRFLSLKTLLEHWKEKLSAFECNDKRKKDLTIELVILKEELESGRWISHLPDLLEISHEGARGSASSPKGQPGKPTAPGLVVKTANAELSDQYRPVFERLAKTLPLQQIERYTEAQEANLYLLTFDTTSGPMSKLVDSLLLTDRLKAAGVEQVDVNGQPKYKFRPYTENTRIGIIPDSLTFNEFNRIFQEDLEMIVRRREDILPNHDREKDLVGIQVLMHRYGPSTRDHYSFELELSRQQATQNLKELLIENLDSKDLASLVHYTGKRDPNAAVMEALISELVGDSVPMTGKAKKELDQQDAELKGQLLGRLKLKDLYELRRRLPGLRKKALEILAELVDTRMPGFTLKKSRSISAAYLDNLASLT
jgi:hypothetical protein